jgi:hypothetical protein
VSRHGASIDLYLVPAQAFGRVAGVARVERFPPVWGAEAERAQADVLSVVVEDEQVAQLASQLVSHGVHVVCRAQVVVGGSAATGGVVVCEDDARGAQGDGGAVHVGSSDDTCPTAGRVDAGEGEQARAAVEEGGGPRVLLEERFEERRQVVVRRGLGSSWEVDGVEVLAQGSQADEGEGEVT